MYTNNILWPTRSSRTTRRSWPYGQLLISGHSIKQNSVTAGLKLVPKNYLQTVNTMLKQGQWFSNQGIPSIPPCTCSGMWSVLTTNHFGDCAQMIEEVHLSVPAGARPPYMGALWTLAAVSGETWMLLSVGIYYPLGNQNTAAGILWGNVEKQLSVEKSTSPFSNIVRDIISLKW